LARAPGLGIWRARVGDLRDKACASGSGAGGGVGGGAEADLNIDPLDAATLWKLREFCDGAPAPEVEAPALAPPGAAAAAGPPAIAEPGSAPQQQAELSPAAQAAQAPAVKRKEDT
jgi:hypothetical protein